MKKVNYIIWTFVSLLCSCGDFLDVVPDNVATIDNAFVDKTNAEKFLFTCYSYLPEHDSPGNNPAFTAGDEAWLSSLRIERWSGSLNSWKIARGEQNVTNPLMNFWDGKDGGKPLFKGIRDCNIFLENIHKPADLDDMERARWVAEVKFLKAYYHYYLMLLYGPIPITRENIDVSSGTEAVRVFREPVKEVADYIAELVDEAAPDLPLEIMNAASEMGRITRPIALALKAKAYLLVASPLFNGNTDFFAVDKRGKQIFSQEYDPQLWQLAADASLDAIKCAEEAGHVLYRFVSPGRQLSDTTIAKMSIRGAVTDRWNKEIIWGATSGAAGLQQNSFPANKAWASNYYATAHYMPTYRMAELFYTDNGVPIEEDKNWDYASRLKLKKAGEEDKYYIGSGYETHQLNFHREVRYHANMIFDGSSSYGFGQLDDKKQYVFELKPVWKIGTYSGYQTKKTVYYESVANNSTAAGSLVLEPYSFPIIRLADLYLMYAEALNEVKTAPDAEVYKYIDLVRERASLKGVVESWAQNSILPEKPLSKSGMRDIIRQERLIELAFEGHRFHDLRRWKLSYQQMNKPIQGWILEDDELKLKNQFVPKFERKDYLWPISLYNILVNTNLVQNPGWE